MTDFPFVVWRHEKDTEDPNRHPDDEAVVLTPGDAPPGHSEDPR